MVEQSVDESVGRLGNQWDEEMEWKMVEKMGKQKERKLVESSVDWSVACSVEKKEFHSVDYSEYPLVEWKDRKKAVPKAEKSDNWWVDY
jgi:hypothetical protein